MKTVANSEEELVAMVAHDAEFGGPELRAARQFERDREEEERTPEEAAYQAANIAAGFGDPYAEDSQPEETEKEQTYPQPGPDGIIDLVLNPETGVWE